MFAEFISEAGLSVISILVSSLINTMPSGSELITTKGFALPNTGIITVSCNVNGYPFNFLFTNLTKPKSVLKLISPGANIILFAALISAFLIITFSDKLTPAFFLITPSILIICLFKSSGYAGQATAAVTFLPLSSTISPVEMPIAFIASLFNLILPLITSLFLASATTNSISPFTLSIIITTSYLIT